MTVLVGLPRDERAAAAVHLGVMLARSLDEDLLVCTVVPPPWPPGMARIDAEYQEYLDRSAQDAIEEARRLVPADRTADYVVARARSTSAGLLEVARERGARLLVLGSSTAGVLGRVAFGSVADRLLHSSPLPVVLGPRGFRCRPDAAVRRVTAAFGATEGADELVVAVAGVAARAKAALRVASFAVRPRGPRRAGRRRRGGLVPATTVTRCAGRLRGTMRSPPRRTRHPLRTHPTRPGGGSSVSP
jgi:nucleotide-binding universal stress UspA family protein